MDDGLSLVVYKRGNMALSDKATHDEAKSLANYLAFTAHTEAEIAGFDPLSVKTHVEHTGNADEDAIRVTVWIPYVREARQ